MCTFTSSSMRCEDGLASVTRQSQYHPLCRSTYPFPAMDVVQQIILARGATARKRSTRLSWGGLRLPGGTSLLRFAVHGPIALLQSATIAADHLRMNIDCYTSRDSCRCDLTRALGPRVLKPPLLTDASSRFLPTCRRLRISAESRRHTSSRSSSRGSGLPVRLAIP